MSKKRFFMSGYVIWDSQNDNRRVSTETAYKLLNELNDENNELKGLIDLFAQDICDLTELLCKNNIDYKLHSDVTNFIVKWGIRID